MTSPTTDRRFGLNSNVAIKAPCAVATTANITLNGEQTIDGVLTSSTRVLVKNQTSSIDNGIYDSDTGDWTRAADCNGNYDLVTGSLVYVTGGTTTTGYWYCTSTGTIVLGTSAITFGQSSTVLATVTAWAQNILAAATAAAAWVFIKVGAIADANTWAGIQTFNDGKFVLSGLTSGTKTVKAPAVAGTTTATFGAGTGIVPVPSTEGTSGQILTSAGAGVQPTWAAASGFMGLTAAINANALTATLASGTLLLFNDGTNATTAAPLTVTASSGSTLGTVNATASRIWVVAVKNGGTPELALRNNVSGTSISWPALRSTITTVAEGGAGAADSAQVFYSTTLRVSQPWCVVGYIDSTQTTAGTWAQALTLTQGFGPGIPTPGSVVQRVAATNTTRIASTSIIPADDTIPQITEGDSANVDCVITPNSASNVLVVDSVVCIGTNSAGAATAALFRDGAANAILAGATSSNASNTYARNNLHYECIGNTASSTTFRVNFGTNSGGNGDLNGSGLARVYGGVNVTSNVVQEIQS